MWVQLSFIVFTVMSIQDIVHRYFIKLGYNPLEIVMYGLIPTVLFGLIYILIQNKKLIKPPPKDIALFIASGIVSFFTFMWIRQAQILSPNIGYVNAIIYSSLFITIIGTAVIFKDKIHIQGLVGTLFIIIGIGLVGSINQEEGAPTLQ